MDDCITGEDIEALLYERADIVAEYSSIHNTECIYDSFEGKARGCYCQMGTAALDLIFFTGDIDKLRKCQDSELINISSLFQIATFREMARTHLNGIEQTIQLFRELFTLFERDSRYVTAECMELFLGSRYVHIPACKSIIPANELSGMFAKGMGQAEVTNRYLFNYTEGNAERITIYYCGRGRINIFLSKANGEMNGVSNAIAASIYECLKRGKKLKKCALCGKWFFPVKDNREKYCSRVTYGGKSCMEYSATARETKRRSTSEIERKLHSVRQTFDNCWRLSEKDIFNEGVKEERKKYNAGLISEADFLIWIEENRGRKNKGGGNNGERD